MAKADRAAKLLEEVAGLRRAGQTPAGLTRLREILRANEAIAVSAAVRLATGWSYPELAGDLVAVFERFLTLIDPGCEVKTAAARYLCETSSEAGRGVFERGVRLEQFEPVFGGQTDVARALRSWCALGLSAIGHRDQVRLILPLLADPDPDAVVRAHAARALGQSESDAGEALLRLKALIGDRDEGVTAEVLTALATGWPERSLRFFEELLAEPERRETAHSPKPPRPPRRLVLQAMALSRSDRAWGVLLREYEGDLSPERRREVLGAMAICRRPEAIGWLLQLLQDGGTAEAVMTVEALAVRREDRGLWGKVEAAVRDRGSAVVSAAWTKASQRGGE